MSRFAGVCHGRDSSVIAAARRRAGGQVAVAAAIPVLVVGVVVLILDTVGLPCFGTVAAAVAVGLLATGAAAMAVSRWAVAPLADALGRQRRFAADVSHELRTPIAHLHTRVQLMLRRAERADAGRADAGPAPAGRDGTGPFGAATAAPGLLDLERLVAGTTRLGEIVDDLLRSAQLAAGPAPEHVDLVAVAEAAVAAEAEHAVARGVSVSVSGPVGPLRVPGVPSALRRVIGELLTNALRHTPSGGRIAVTVRRRDDRAELVVADTGDGFDPTRAEAMFDRFQRGTGAGHPGERHVGLGLALMREVVTDHGGTIEVDGHPGRGASFTVRLPTAAGR